MQKISPFIWFDNNAEEAISFYLPIFKDSKAGRVMQAMMKMIKLDIATLKAAADAK